VQEPSSEGLIDLLLKFVGALGMGGLGAASAWLIARRQAQTEDRRVQVEAATVGLTAEEQEHQRMMRERALIQDTAEKLRGDLVEENDKLRKRVEYLEQRMNTLTDEMHKMREDYEQEVFDLRSRLRDAGIEWGRRTRDEGAPHGSERRGRR
jgi:flagellar motility protein MotE (MotC chaperone)